MKVNVDLNLCNEILPTVLSAKIYVIALHFVRTAMNAEDKYQERSDLHCRGGYLPGIPGIFLILRYKIYRTESLESRIQSQVAVI